jgi:hypothetical protein
MSTDSVEKPESFARENFRPSCWYFSADLGRVPSVIRLSGAPSIFMGRTPHEVRDELCRALGSAGA